MAETHFVEIPIDSDTTITTVTTTTTDNNNSDEDHDVSNGQQCLVAHPIAEVSESPGHLLLLKLYRREEDQLSHKLVAKEFRLDGIKREAFRLSSLFLAFHVVFLTLLFAVSLDSAEDGRRTCREWWLPCSLSLLTSLVLVSSVRLRVCEYWRVLSQLQREREHGRALTRCVRELKMKGPTFDLSREPHVPRRVRSSSVGIRWRPLEWLKQNLVTMCLLCVAGLLVPACKFMLCCG